MQSSRNGTGHFLNSHIIQMMPLKRYTNCMCQFHDNKENKCHSSDNKMPFIFFDKKMFGTIDVSFNFVPSEYFYLFSAAL